MARRRSWSHATVVWLVALVGLAVGGCASSPPDSDEEDDAVLHGPPSDQRPSDSDVPSEVPIRTEILGGSTPFAAKIQPDGWEDIDDGVATLAEALPLGSRLQSTVETLHTEGLYGGLASEVGGFDELRHLSEGEAVYLRADILGAGRYLRAARVGLPVPPPDERGLYPAGPRLRMLLPTDRPVALADEIERAWDEEAESDAERVAAPERGYTRVDIFWPNREYVADERIDEIVDRLGEVPKGRPAADTSSVERLRRAEAPVTVYSDIGDLQTWYLARTGVQSATAAAGANGADRRRIAVTASAATSGVGLLSLRSARSYEDYLVTIEGDGEGAMTVEGVAARTDRGARLGQLAELDIEVPAFQARAAPEASLIADLRLARDFEALRRQSPGAVEVVGGNDAALSGAGAIAQMRRASGAGAWLATLHSPEHLSNVFGSYIQERYGVPPPSALYLRVAGAGAEADIPIRGGLQALFNLGDTEAERDEITDNLDRWLEAIPTGSIDWQGELERRDDGFGRVALAVGTSLETLLADESTDISSSSAGGRIVPARLLSALEGFRISAEKLEPFGGLADMPPVAFETASSRTRTKFRFRFGGGRPEALEAGESEASLPEVGPAAACLDRVTVAVHKFKRALEATDPRSLSTQKRLAERFASRLPECPDAAEVSSDDLQWFRGRAIWLLAWRAAVIVGNQTEGIARCRPGGEDADLRGASCLERAAARASDEQLRGMRRAANVAETMYRRACELGDELACGKSSDFEFQDD